MQRNTLCRGMSIMYETDQITEFNSYNEVDKLYFTILGGNRKKHERDQL